MDFLDFEGQDLYFDEPVSDQVAELIQQAADLYPNAEAEAYLLRSYFLEPQHLTVLVALYRYFYYRHRYQDALLVAERALVLTGERLGLRTEWQQLSMSELGNGILVSMGFTRFYLLVLKASGYLKLRVGDVDDAILRLEKVVELDPRDQFGAGFLLDLALKARADRFNGRDVECIA